MASVFTLVLVLQQSSENCSILIPLVCFFLSSLFFFFLTQTLISTAVIDHLDFLQTDRYFRYFSLLNVVIFVNVVVVCLFLTHDNSLMAGDQKGG